MLKYYANHLSTFTPTITIMSEKNGNHCIYYIYLANLERLCIPSLSIIS